jgi:hypothetical protein
MLSLCLCASGLSAKDIVLGNAPRGAVTGVKLAADEILAVGDAALGFEAVMTTIQVADLKTPNGTFTQLTIPGFQHSPTIGAPALPVMNQLVEIPFGAKVEAKVLSSDIETYDLKDLGITNKIMPRQAPQPKDGSKVPFAFEKRVYNTKGFYQEPLANVEVIGAMRHVNLAQLTISPVAYDPQAGKLEVHNNVKVRLHITDGNMKKTMDIKAAYGSRAFDWLYNKVQSPASLKLLNHRAENRPVHFVIVADGQFKADLAPYIAWKTQKGFNVTVGYTDEIGATRDEIKAFIHGLYNNPGELGAPEFVLFVGDHDNLPAWQGKSGSHITDLYYVAVTEGDTLPDILTGRFSAKTSADLLPQIAKTLEYEKYEFADPSFLTRVTMIAGWDSRFAVEWGWPQINYGVDNYFNATQGIATTHKYLSAGSSQNEDKIFANIDEGCSYVNYTAHGSSTSWADPSFTKTDIAALKNTGKYPLIVGNCCLTNKFEVDTCFGEAWLRAENKGAIGYIGGSNSTYWDEDLWWGNGFYPIKHPNKEGLAPAKADTGPGAYDGIFEGPHFTNGGMVLAGNLAVEASNSSRKLYYWEVYHLMGDPSMRVYWGIPQAATVQLAEGIAAGSTTVELTGPAGAYVGITVDGALYGAGVIGDNGTAAIEVKALPADAAAQVVVTGNNLKPFIGTLAVQ